MYNRLYNSKYNSRKIIIEGQKFDSKKEYLRYLQLLDLEKEGKIKDLQRQVIYELIPTQREDNKISKNGKIKPGKVIERACKYAADFVYFDIAADKIVVEDVKGYKKAGAYNLFTIKRKLMLYKYGIKIKEV